MKETERPVRELNIQRARMRMPHCVKCGRFVSNLQEWQDFDFEWYGNGICKVHGVVSVSWEAT